MDLRFELRLQPARSAGQVLRAAWPALPPSSPVTISLNDAVLLALLDALDHGRLPLEATATRRLLVERGWARHGEGDRVGITRLGRRELDHFRAAFAPRRTTHGEATPTE